MSLRVQRVRELMKRELSVILERDYEFGGALVTLHDVDLTPDLKQAFVYVGVLGAKGREEGIIEKLERYRGRIQSALYKRVTLRYSPQLTFRLDQSIERGVKVLNLIDSLPEPAADEEEEKSDG